MLHQPRPCSWGGPRRRSGGGGRPGREAPPPWPPCRRWPASLSSRKSRGGHERASPRQRGNVILIARHGYTPTPRHGHAVTRWHSPCPTFLLCPSSGWRPHTSAYYSYSTPRRCPRGRLPCCSGQSTASARRQRPRPPLPEPPFPSPRRRALPSPASLAARSGSPARLLRSGAKRRAPCARRPDRREIGRASCRERVSFVV